MPQCQFMFSAVFVFQKSCSGNILGIGRKSTEVPILPTHTRSPKGRRRSARRRPHKGSARPHLLPRRGCVWAPRGSPDATLSPIYSSRLENPKKKSHIPRKVPELRRHRNQVSWVRICFLMLLLLHFLFLCEHH